MEVCGVVWCGVVWCGVVCCLLCGVLCNVAAMKECRQQMHSTVALYGKLLGG